MIAKGRKPEDLHGPLWLGIKVAATLRVSRSTSFPSMFFLLCVCAHHLGCGSRDVIGEVGVQKPANLRRLFGANEVKQKLQQSHLRLDSLFTGVDCPHAAMMQLSAACRRRNFQCA